MPSYILSRNDFPVSKARLRESFIISAPISIYPFCSVAGAEAFAGCPVTSPDDVDGVSHVSADTCVFSGVDVCETVSVLAKNFLMSEVSYEHFSKLISIRQIRLNKPQTRPFISAEKSSAWDHLHFQPWWAILTFIVAIPAVYSVYRLFMMRRFLRTEKSSPRSLPFPPVFINDCSCAVIFSRILEEITWAI